MLSVKMRDTRHEKVKINHDSHGKARTEFKNYQQQLMEAFDKKRKYELNFWLKRVKKE